MKSFKSLIVQASSFLIAIISMNIVHESKGDISLQDMSNINSTLGSQGGGTCSVTPAGISANNLSQVYCTSSKGCALVCQGLKGQSFTGTIGNPGATYGNCSCS